MCLFYECECKLTGWMAPPCTGPQCQPHETPNIGMDIQPDTHSKVYTHTDQIHARLLSHGMRTLNCNCSPKKVLPRTKKCCPMGAAKEPF